jgi:hypothetical protein
MEGAGPAVENAVFQWEEGYSRVESARSEPGRQRVLARVVNAVQDELRKRLGSRFTVSELADLYRRDGDMLVDVGVAAVASSQDLTDVAAAADAAFYLYMREAADFGGGRAPTRRE